MSVTKDYVCPSKLKLVLDHIQAVRTVYDYVNSKTMETDIQSLSYHVMQELNRTVLRPAGWEDAYMWKGSLYSGPFSKPWQVVRDDYIAMEVYTAWPVGDDNDPYVALYVPAKWKRLSRFTDILKAPKTFEHINQHPKDDYLEQNPIFKHVRYGDFAISGGSFNLAGFVNAFIRTARTLVSWEKRIDKAPLHRTTVVLQWEKR